jgi:pimeloyl-ACP methyl ester carboxylesterase
LHGLAYTDGAEISAPGSFTLNAVVTRFRVSGSLQLAADVFEGSGRGVVMLAHGGGQTRHSWARTGQHLAARGWTAISLDLRGHGESDWAEDGDYQLRRFCEDLMAVAASCPDRPALIGASLGGLAGLFVETIFGPGTFSSLTLVDIVPRADPQGVSKILGFMGANLESGFASLEDAADSIAAYLPHRPRPTDLSGLRKNLRLGDDGRFRWHWDPRFLSNPAAPPPRDIAPPVEPDYGAIDIPVHLVRGRMSELVSLEAAQAFLARLKHGSLTDVADAGHMVAGDRNDVFLEAVTGFLERQAAAPTVRAPPLS